MLVSGAGAALRCVAPDAASSSNLIRSAFLKLSRFCNHAALHFTIQPKLLQAHKETDLCADVVNTLSRGWPMCRYDMKPLMSHQLRLGGGGAMLAVISLGTNCLFQPFVAEMLN